MKSLNSAYLSNFWLPACPDRRRRQSGRPGVRRFLGQQWTRPGTQTEADRRADGSVESGGTGRSRPSGGQNRAVAHRRSVPLGTERWGISYSETGMLRLLWSLDLSHRQRKGPTGLQKRGFAACLREIVQAHPQAERFDLPPRPPAQLLRTNVIADRQSRHCEVPLPRPQHLLLPTRFSCNFFVESASTQFGMTCGDG
jgi:hypothetical protein